MLTPQEVSEHAFAKASFGGYNMAMVDEFLDLLTDDYTTLYKDNATLKAKMKVLADKIEEYRSTEDAMRKTLLTAQRMADELVDEAKAEKEKMLKEAAADLALRKNELDQQLRDEQARLAAAQASTAAYVEKLKDLYQHELEYIGGLSQLKASNAAPVTDSVAKVASDISAAVDHLVEEETPTPSAEPEKTETDGNLYAELQELTRKKEAPAPSEDDDDTAPTRRIDLDHLQFGSGYKFD